MTATVLTPDARTARERIVDTSGAPGPFVVVHTLTTLVAVNINQDADGLPKRCVVGDVERMRVSSQALARAARIWAVDHYNHQRPASGRSRLLPQETARRLQHAGIDSADATAGAALIVAAAGLSISPTDPGRTRTVSLMPQDAPDRLADVALAHWVELAPQRADMDKAIAAALTKVARKSKGEVALDPARDVPEDIVAAARRALDPALTNSIAIFGRMVTELPDGTMTSSVQIAHGFSVDPFDLLVDDFTVRDDWQDLGVFGAALIGRSYLTSGTLYRYAALDRQALRANLARAGATAFEVEDAAQHAEKAFVTGIAYALPTARRSRTGSAVRPLLVVAGSCDEPLTAAAAFETPVDPPAGPNAADLLARHLSWAGLRGGTARWHSPTGAPAPDLPGCLTVEA
ncbi:type I-E CRISPR-associated protein Cas7/Cse4/CasC [Streptomyces sp. 8L]|uniref:type I-E CRISPR-associated protein Cas7/Cse4/CasC n=1 Tax=Streptomyces sp. 8L TaxID=2877242 RepID=UPI001CD766E4|nr:type I-E CRISPR-associated protein Cas7/Cse4/CasC [Streptomyces sp. 8L]MCA1222558.1 type I-E CRISPR-associated protein Cas7/Cse4/CasC [Streptomyces sp. 8L]